MIFFDWRRTSPIELHWKFQILILFNHTICGDIGFFEKTVNFFFSFENTFVSPFPRFKTSSSFSRFLFIIFPFESFQLYC